MNGWKRRLFHLCSIALLLIAALLVPRGIFLICLGGVTIAILGLELSRLLISPSLNRWLISRVGVLMRKRETTRPWSSTYVLLAALLVFWLFENNISIVTLCFLAVGDPAASIIGEKFGRRKIWGKSLEGTAACFLSCLVIGVFLANRVLSVSLLAILAGSFCAALMELLPLHLNDNIAIPILPAGVMTAVR